VANHGRAEPGATQAPCDGAMSGNQLGHGLLVIARPDRIRQRLGRDVRLLGCFCRNCAVPRNVVQGHELPSMDADDLTVVCFFVCASRQWVAGQTLLRRVQDRRRSRQWMVAQRWDTERLVFHRLPGEVYPQSPSPKRARRIPKRRCPACCTRRGT
jgi:hypothetical protein